MCRTRSWTPFSSTTMIWCCLAFAAT
ncbi:hypothetical protein E2C01_100544 [Portunus trituberculatus]|uniref:Uncharacterized protein n=1 Tax=Portunus trituberculatus TaxID=210409 RepID=A0A5B7K8A9_PORTR|nr:hypothetical protein [Portunus trituberculatus]